jgi:hypothetical protein
MFYFWQGQEIFHYSSASIPALGPTMPPIQWIPEAFPLMAKRQEREAGLCPLSRAEIKNGGAIRLLPNTSTWRGA